MTEAQQSTLTSNPSEVCDYLDDIISKEEILEFQGLEGLYNNNVDKFLEKAPKKENLFNGIVFVLKYITQPMNPFDRTGIQPNSRMQRTGWISLIWKVTPVIEVIFLANMYRQAHLRGKKALLRILNANLVNAKNEANNKWVPFLTSLKEILYPAKARVTNENEETWSLAEENDKLKLDASISEEKIKELQSKCESLVLNDSKTENSKTEIYSLQQEIKICNLNQELKSKEIRLNEIVSRMNEMERTTLDTISLLNENFKLKFKQGENVDSSGKSYKIEGLQEFRGSKTESIEEWLFIVSDALKNNGIPQGKEFAVIAPLLRENALQEYMHLKKNNQNLTWVELKAHFGKIYENRDEERQLRDKLRDLVEEKPDYLDFQRRFLELRTRLRDLPKKELLDSFVAGLHGRIKIEVVKYMNNPTEKTECANNVNATEKLLEKVMRIAGWVYEFGSNENSHSELPKSVNFARHATNNYRKFNFYEDDYPSEEDDSSSEPGNEENEEKPLSRRFQDLEKNNKSYNRPYNNYNENIICYKCRQPGHKANRCYSKRPQGSYLAETVDDSESCNIVVDLHNVFNRVPSELMNTECLIDNMKCNACVDTGATRSIISRKAARKYKINIKPSDVKVKMADNTVVSVTGVSNILDVTVEKKTVQLSFLIVETVESVILGQDWLRLSDAILWPGRKNIVFPNENLLYAEKMLETARQADI
jgi:hypothetical protein